MCSGRVDERTNEFAASALFFTRKSKHLRRKPKLANRAHVDQTMLYRLIIHNVQPGQRATGPLARSQCDAPLFAPGPQYRRHQSTPRRRAPQRLSPRTQHRGVLGRATLWRPSARLWCSSLHARSKQSASAERQGASMRVPGLRGWAETRTTDRERRHPLIREGHIEVRQAIERTSTGSLIDESRSRWRLAAPPPRARTAARGGLSRDSAEGVLRACQAAVGGARERCSSAGTQGRIQHGQW